MDLPFLFLTSVKAILNGDPAERDDQPYATPGVALLSAWSERTMRSLTGLPCASRVASSSGSKASPIGRTSAPRWPQT